MNTKELIVKTALDLFNEKGIEYGGMRELAGILNVRVSNITYYFPTKDELVIEIAKDLRLINSQVFENSGFDSIAGFMEMYRKVFFNQYAYRCLMLSFVHLVTQNASMAKGYKEVERKRKKQIASHISTLMKNGYIQNSITKKQLQSITGSISLVSRFWISEARISYPELSVNNVTGHYIKILAGFIFPYATPKGKRQLDEKYM